MTIQIKAGDGTKQIPKANYYVLSNDTFMSGWGPAKNKTNTLVIPCKDYEEAQRVQQYARSRTDQKRVRIVGNKLRLRPGVLYSVVQDRKDFSAWYS